MIDSEFLTLLNFSKVDILNDFAQRTRCDRRARFEFRVFGGDVRPSFPGCEEIRIATSRGCRSYFGNRHFQCDRLSDTFLRRL